MIFIVNCIKTKSKGYFSLIFEENEACTTSEPLVTPAFFRIADSYLSESQEHSGFREVANFTRFFQIKSNSSRIAKKCISHFPCEKLKRTKIKTLDWSGKTASRNSSICLLTETQSDLNRTYLSIWSTVSSYENVPPFSIHLTLAVLYTAARFYWMLPDQNLLPYWILSLIEILVDTTNEKYISNVIAKSLSRC